MKALTIIAGLVSICISMPIWFFLQYEILVIVHADRLMWFLFWVYVPALFFAACIERVAKAATKD